MQTTQVVEAIEKMTRLAQTEPWPVVSIAYSKIGREATPNQAKTTIGLKRQLCHVELILHSVEWGWTNESFSVWTRSW